MLTTFKGRQTKMAACLAGRPVAEIAKSSREVVTGDVARKSQAVMTPGGCGAGSYDGPTMARRRAGVRPLRCATTR